MHSRWSVWVAVFVALLSVGAERRIGIEPSTKQARQYQKVEFSLNAEIVCDNPYDPAEVDFQLELVLPSGRKVSIPAFYYQPYERRPLSQGNSEWLYPVGPAVWKARFAPTEIGSYTCTAVLKDRSGTSRSESLTFDCAASQDRGFIRVSPKDRRYLEFDNGTPFFAVGQDAAFVTNSYATAEKLRRLGENGANFSRIWACSEDWAMAIEARKSAFGRSWDWNPPIVATPDRDGYHAGDLCLKLTGDAGASLSISPANPVAVRPNTRYRLAGQLRTNSAMDVSLDLGQKHTLPGKRQWTKFQQEFTTGADQWWLGNPTFRLTSKGTAWLGDLSLKEADGGPELLWQADVNRPALGVYNQPDCFMLDQIIEAAEQNGVYLQVVLFTRDLYMSHLSKENSPEYDRAIAYGKRLVRYCVARWGYSTHVALWEYFNEMNPGLPTDRFYTELGQVFEQIDINRHLRANSTWNVPSKDDRHPKLDTADIHFYLRPPNGESWKDEVASVQSRWKLMHENAPDRPIIFSEFGITDKDWQRAPELDKDKEFVHLHNALWTSALSGFASTVCHWYWDDIHKRDLYPIYRPISRFTADIPWTSSHLRPAAATSDKGVRVIGLQGDQGVYLWIFDPNATWWKIAMENASPQEMRDVSITLAEMGSGPYQVQWWDTRRGEVIAQTQVHTEGTMTLRVPAFSRDIACKVIKAAP